MSASLVPLRIPNGWAVITNHFGDEDPIVRDGHIVNDLYYCEDLLSIESIKHEGGLWVNNVDGHAIDLGWYPDSNPEGKYRLVVMRRDWNNVLVKVESTDRHVIRVAIERCLEMITQGVEDQEISYLFKTEEVQPFRQ